MKLLSMSILASISCALSVAHAQIKVAQYFTGKYGTDEYENFSFWIKDGRRTEIIYEYGKIPKTLKVEFFKKDFLERTPCFVVKLSNNYVLYIIPTKSKLKITDSTSKYLKIFAWEYEGPVNGIGTYCEVCAEDEKEAMKTIQQYYIK